MLDRTVLPGIRLMGKHPALLSVFGDRSGGQEPGWTVRQRYYPSSPPPNVNVLLNNTIQK